MNRRAEAAAAADDWRQTDMSAASLSIMLPVLNERETPGAMLVALQPFAQGRKVIVVDGGSGDGTPALARGRTVQKSERYCHVSNMRLHRM